MREKVSIHDLPEMAQEIAFALGDDLQKTMEILEKWGGSRFAIPSATHPFHEDHPLVVKVGIEQARRLAQYFDGETIEVPMGAEVARKMMMFQALAEFTKGGVTAEQLARKYKVHRRTMHRWLKKASE